MKILLLACLLSPSFVSASDAYIMSSEDKKIEITGDRRISGDIYDLDYDSDYQSEPCYKGSTREIKEILETAIKEAKDEGDDRDTFELVFEVRGHGRIDYLIHMREFRRSRRDIGASMIECK